MNVNFWLRSSDVVHETLEGETVIIDLRTGSYFSAAGWASHLFLKAIGGSSLEDVMEYAAKTYPEHPQAAAEAEAYLHSLVVLGALVTTVPADAAVDGTEGLQEPPADYTAPILEGYEDMTDLLLLDPIHEVDPAEGWPNFPQPAPGAD